MKLIKTYLMPLLLLALTTSHVCAADDVINTGDTAWMLTSTVLVLMMCLPGLALFYGGLVRAKNVLSIFVQCFAMAGVMSILWVAFGYAIAAGSGGSAYFGWDKSLLFLNHISEDTLNGTIPESVWVTFQMTFIIIVLVIK